MGKHSHNHHNNVCNLIITAKPSLRLQYPLSIPQYPRQPLKLPISTLSFTSHPSIHHVPINYPESPSEAPPRSHAASPATLPRSRHNPCVVIARLTLRMKHATYCNRGKGAGPRDGGANVVCMWLKVVVVAFMGRVLECLAIEIIAW